MSLMSLNFRVTQSAAFTHFTFPPSLATGTNVFLTCDVCVCKIVQTVILFYTTCSAANNSVLV